MESYQSIGYMMLQDGIDSLCTDQLGLITAVIQQFDTKEVLMVGMMTPNALKETLRTGLVHFWSRKRKKLWCKGETSGQWQHVIEVRTDCDADALLILVNQNGVACHTGRRTCFYKTWTGSQFEETLPVEISPEELYPAEK